MIASEHAGRAGTIAWLSLGLLLAALAWDASGLDLPLAHLAGSRAGFPLQDNWWLATFLHEGGKRLAWLLEIGLFVGIWWPAGPLRRLPRAGRVRLAVSVLAAAAAVSLLKSASATSCPWDLVDFGGLAHYTSHWSLQPDGGPGRCFPAGQAASGFSFLGGYFAFLAVRPRLAGLWLAAAAASGLLLGLAQQWRGAHFMSHTLWSAATCWGVACAVHAWPVRRRSTERT